MKGLMKPGPPSSRYVFIDALRGIAAMGVVLFHALGTPVMRESMDALIPDAIEGLKIYGAAGVQMFFIISGFVIAHSLRGVYLNGAGVGRFILRRQVRLDPPYWFTIALILALSFFKQLAGVGDESPAVGPSVVLANMVYLQDLIQVEAIVDVGWTLCIEIQFYLFFILLLSMGRLTGWRGRAGEPSRLSVLLVFVMGVFSLGWLDYTGTHFGNPWFYAFWMYFAGGALCYWVLHGQVGLRVFVVYLVLFLIVMARRPSAGMHVGAVSLAMIYFVGRAGHLTDWLGGRVLLFLGRISYSLYLVHLVVIGVVFRIVYMLIGDSGAAAAWGGLVVSVLASLLAAWGVYCLVERPSMRWVAKIAKQ